MKKGIALLITLLFIISITFAIGLGLKQVKEATYSAKEESFLIQTSIILDDVMTLLKNTKEIDLILKEKSPEILDMFLSSASFIPFESSGIKMIIELSSARAKFNPNTMVELNTTLNVEIENALKVYLNEYRINEDYVDLLKDCMSKVKQDMSYNTDIFNEKPYLFRDYITSLKHFNEINDFYVALSREEYIRKVDFTKLFYFSKDRNYKIDLNQATPEVWKLLLGCDDTRAKQLSDDAGSYEKIQDLLLSDGEKMQLAHFKTDFFQPILEVKVEIMQNNMNAKIDFEYNMKTKRGSNFNYEI